MPWFNCLPLTLTAPCTGNCSCLQTGMNKQGETFQERRGIRNSLMQALHQGDGINTAVPPQAHWDCKAFCLGLHLGSDIKEQVLIAFAVNSYIQAKNPNSFITTKPAPTHRPSCKMFAKEGRLGCHKGERDKTLYQRRMPRSPSLCLRILSNENPLPKHQHFCCCHNTRKLSTMWQQKLAFKYYNHCLES